MAGMFAFEQNRLYLPARADWRRDVAGAGLLVALTVALLMWWQPGLALQLEEVAGPIGSGELLMALAMLIALRVGVLDLSVWVSPMVSALLSGSLINVGVPLGLSMVCGVVLGAALGALKGWLVMWRWLPAVAVTLAMAAGLAWVAQQVWPEPVALAPETFQPWLMGRRIEGELVAVPLTLTRILLVLAGFLVGVTVCLRPRSPHAGPAGPARTFWALTVAGGLLGLAGGVEMLDHYRAAAPHRWIGDLRVPASVILAGGLLFVGYGRDRLAGVCLPVAILAVTLWRFWWVEWGACGYEWQVAYLAGAVMAIHIILRCLFRGREIKSADR